MSTLNQIFTLVATIVPLLSGLLTFIIKYVKSEKGTKILSQSIKISETIQSLICKAEEFKHFSGEEKKEYVLTQLNRMALEQSLFFDREKISDQIDELVNTTKRVNARDKDVAEKFREEIKKSI